MDAESWTARLSSASKRYQSALLSRSGLGASYFSFFVSSFTDFPVIWNSSSFQLLF